MTYSIEVAPAAAKALTKIDKKFQLRLAGAIELLAIDPRLPAAKMLRGGEQGRWRIHIGDYRVSYVTIDERLLVLVLSHSHRRECHVR